MMTFVTLNDMPEDHKNTFFQMFSTAMCNNATKEQAKSHTREAFTYLMCIFWQGRFNKMSHDQIYMFDWICDHLVSPEYQYDGNRKDGLLINHPDHHALALECFHLVWNAYVKTDGNHYVKKGFFVKMMEKFNKKA